MDSELIEIWNNITEELEQSVTEEWWNSILSKYNEKGRNCHDFESLVDKFQNLSVVSSNIKNLKAVKFALFFQYYEYDAKSLDCQSNVESFIRFATESKLRQIDASCFEAVKELLEGAATHCTDAHTNANTYGDQDLHYLLDIDMLVLGSNSEQYEEYKNKLRLEYEFLDQNAYCNLRKKVLQSFLMIPNIFATQTFRIQYEEKARNNMSTELEELRR